eukprot:CAMPEP_0202723094 /NCGR_PEP_ID=MMETSP1385-20130828/163058_1 /ASSEMBLY_ACC=CAM_ASM_000861 /TAXON_ID=933848 /ORGANISM="Elphidium margaritaceum" /LENGTH=135 /DNA_ID=CAMNT_0049388087 /DNA_START=31 /DNA_END=438 /DNA_ORIENTATION=+
MTSRTREMKVSMQKRKVIAKWLFGTPSDREGVCDEKPTQPLIKHETPGADNQSHEITVMPAAQKEKVQILWNLRIRSQKHLMQQNEIPDEFLDSHQKEHELRLSTERKLKQKCHNLRISAEGNKTALIERIMRTK